MRDQQPFRFLDLPTELRLMVYEQLPPSTTTRTLTWNYLECFVHGVGVVPARDSGEQMLSLQHAILPFAIRATCKQIRKEAPSILSKTMHEHQPQVVAMNDPMYPGFAHYRMQDHFLVAILAMLQAAHKHGILLPETEAMKAYHTTSAITMFNAHIVPTQTRWILDFTRRCVQYANKNPNLPCMSVKLGGSLLKTAVVIDGPFKRWRIGFRVRFISADGHSGVFSQRDGNAVWILDASCDQVVCEILNLIGRS